jgi:hypothetical protein
MKIKYELNFEIPPDLLLTAPTDPLLDSVIHDAIYQYLLVCHARDAAKYTHLPNHLPLAEYHASWRDILQSATASIVRG